MKKQTTNPVGTLAAIGMLAALTLLPATPAGAQSHLSFATHGLTGPNGGSRAHVGDTMEFHAAVVNLDDSQGSVTVNEVFLVIHRRSGDVKTSNLASNAPVIREFEAAEFSTTFVVQPEDGDMLSLDCDIRWTDNWDGFDVGSPLVHSASYSDAVQILKPAVTILQQCHGSPAYPHIAFGGIVTNTGNTPLHNVVVVSDNGTPDNPGDDSTTSMEVLNPNGAASFNGAYTATGPAPNTVTVRGTDALGLTVTHSSISALPVALKIARSGSEAVRISWPGWAEGFRLESSKAAGLEWTAVTNTPVAGNGELSITLGMSATQLYRLVKP